MISSTSGAGYLKAELNAVYRFVPDPAEVVFIHM